MGKGDKKDVALERLSIQQRQVENAVGQMLILPYASYEKRAKMGSGPSADYQGPMGYAGSGTLDQMPGTTSPVTGVKQMDDVLKKFLKLFPQKPKSKKKSLAEQGFI